MGEAADDTRTAAVTARVTDEFADWIRNTARAEQRSQAQLVWVLLGEARRHRETAPTVVRRGITPHGLVEPGRGDVP